MIYHLSDSVEVSMFFLLLVSYLPLDKLGSQISSLAKSARRCLTRRPVLPEDIPLYHQEIITRYPRAAAAS